MKIEKKFYLKQSNANYIHSTEINTLKRLRRPFEARVVIIK